MFRLDVQPRDELVWAADHLTVISRATVHYAPSGIRLGFGEGLCSSREKKYAKRLAQLACPACGQANLRKSRQEGEGFYCWRKTGGCGATFPEGDRRIAGQAAGEIANPDLPDTWNTILKMAKKRAYVDAVLSVTGASAIFTQDIGTDPTETPADAGPAYGPAVGDELKPQASEAAIRVCGGDIDQARALWAAIQAALDGYMPHAAAIALVHAAWQPHAGSVGDRRPTAGAVGQAGPAASSPAAQPEAGEATAQSNRHGLLVASTAGARGIADGELANLIRVAAGSARLPGQRAAAQLEILLERITEPVARQTLELIEMLHPAGGQQPPDGGDRDAVSVDFGSFDPGDRSAA